MNQETKKSKLYKPLIFLSYAKEDKDRVKRIYRRLMAERLNAWLDLANLLPGQEWERVILNTIKNARCVIVFLSNHSVNKRGYVQKEIRKALEASEKVPEGEIFIIPVRLEECVVPESLTKWQWIDMFRPHGFTKIVDALKTRLVEETVKLIIVGDFKHEVTFTLEKSKTIIGRIDRVHNFSPDIDLTFIDPEYKVSRRHARIICQGENMFIEDLGSRNGTMINRSIRLSPWETHNIKNGDTLTLADITLKLVIGDAVIRTVDTQALDPSLLHIDEKS